MSGGPLYLPTHLADGRKTGHRLPVPAGHRDLRSGNSTVFETGAENAQVAARPVSVRRLLTTVLYSPN